MTYLEMYREMEGACASYSDSDLISDFCPGYRFMSEFGIKIKCIADCSHHWNMEFKVEGKMPCLQCNSLI